VIRNLGAGIILQDIVYSAYKYAGGNVIKYSNIMVGRKYTNNQGNSLTVLKIDGRFVSVKFTNTGFVKKVQKHHLREGKAKDPYEPTKYGIACLGNISNYPSEDYKRWENMIERCYRGGGVGNYKDSTVCKRWLTFEFFSDDLRKMTNYGKPKMHLDKDLLVPGNKVYSPETCQLIGDNLNSSKGSFTGCWKATKGSTTIFSTYSTEMASLVGVTASSIRMTPDKGKRTHTGWNISVEK